MAAGSVAGNVVGAEAQTANRWATSGGPHRGGRRTSAREQPDDPAEGARGGQAHQDRQGLPAGLRAGKGHPRSSASASAHVVLPGARRAGRSTSTTSWRLAAGQGVRVRLVVQPVPIKGATGSPGRYSVAICAARRRPAPRGASAGAPKPILIPSAWDGRRVHAGGAGGPRAVLHQPRRPGLRARQPARGRQGRAVRALLALAQVAAPALPRRVRRRDVARRSRRATRDVGAATRRAALRARVHRIRRRLGRAARRRAPGVRGRIEHPDQGARVGPADGLSRAIDALHSLRRPARGAASAITSRPSSTAIGAARALRRDARSAPSTSTRAWLPPMRSVLRARKFRATPAASPRPCTAIDDPRQGARHACAASCRRPRSRTSGIYGTGQAYEAAAAAACARIRCAEVRDCADADARSSCAR